VLLVLLTSSLSEVTWAYHQLAGSAAPGPPLRCRAALQRLAPAAPTAALPLGSEPVERAERAEPEVVLDASVMVI